MEFADLYYGGYHGKEHDAAGNSSRIHGGAAVFVSGKDVAALQWDPEIINRKTQSTKAQSVQREHQHSSTRGPKRHTTVGAPTRPMSPSTGSEKMPLELDAQSTQTPHYVSSILKSSSKSMHIRAQMHEEGQAPSTHVRSANVERPRHERVDRALSPSHKSLNKDEQLNQLRTSAPQRM
ncbi:hypothetical protein FVE85_9619 [Porphyridium purpureum]|uniref:Uncharacterized protein n=1 Tax=Porphyridium purpureum TaxID=35688 RepID=A0A5J4YGE5_PORPP|nr:hypothetical protein FVE85_9619 [Porphyridium purpureum]|eukprot:POR9301..scf267_23